MHYICIYDQTTAQVQIRPPLRFRSDHLSGSDQTTLRFRSDHGSGSDQTTAQVQLNHFPITPFPGFPFPFIANVSVDVPQYQDQAQTW